MKQIHVGTYTLGWFYVDLYLIPDTDGGCFYMAPDDKSMPRIKVGIADTWPEVVSTLIHEALELVLTRRHLRFITSGRISTSPESLTFHFDHNQFNESVTELAGFLVVALPDVATAFRKVNRKPSKAKKHKSKRHSSRRA